MRLRSTFACVLLAFGCSSAPHAQLDTQISGQVIDRQLRELVVTLKNSGSTVVKDVDVAVAVPAALVVVHESHGDAVALRNDRVLGDVREISYVVESLAPGASAAMYLPFHRSGMAALAGREVVVSATLRGKRITQSRHTFPR